MKTVGKLDIEKYRCVEPNILTDEVIITDERIVHIIKRRGLAFYEKYHPYFGKVVSDPDYIFKDRTDHTALACKSFEEDGLTVNLVLRLAVDSDDSRFKNSIITAIKEGKQRFAQRLRNNIPLYKKE